MLKKPTILSKYGFNIGDNVVFVNEIDPDDGVVRGQTGTVCTFEGAEEDCVGVRWTRMLAIIIVAAGTVKTGTAGTCHIMAS